MQPELIAIALGGAAAYGTYRLLGDLWRRTHTLRPRPALPVSSRPMPRPRRPAITPAMKRAARNFQLAMLQLRQSPDFRRAASFAAHAKDVPLWFRQRQYGRFRPLLVDRLAELLRHGSDAQAVMDGLTELVTALGVAGFEADYILAEAKTRVRQRETRPDFSERLRQLQAEHQARLETLQSVSGLDDESREQLLEQENVRFQERLRALTGGDQVHGP